MGGLGGLGWVGMASLALLCLLHLPPLSALSLPVTSRLRPCAIPHPDPHPDPHPSPLTHPDHSIPYRPTLLPPPSPTLIPISIPISIHPSSIPHPSLLSIFIPCQKELPCSKRNNGTERKRERESERTLFAYLPSPQSTHRNKIIHCSPIYPSYLFHTSVPRLHHHFIITAPPHSFRVGRASLLISPTPSNTPWSLSLDHLSTFHCRLLPQEKKRKHGRQRCRLGHYPVA